MADHCNNVSRLCGMSCEAVGLAALGRLIGLTHDLGNADDEWQKYLDKPNGGEKLEHSAAGAYLT